MGWKKLWIWGYAPFFRGYHCQLIIFKNAILEYDHVHIFCCPSYESQCNIWLLVQICVSPFITFCLALQLKAHSEATSHLTSAGNSLNKNQNKEKWKYCDKIVSNVFLFFSCSYVDLILKIMIKAGVLDIVSYQESIAFSSKIFFFCFG